MRSHFEQAFDGLDSDDAEVRLRSRRILEAERLRQDALEPAMETKPVKFSKRLASMPLPKSKRRMKREGALTMVRKTAYDVVKSGVLTMGPAEFLSFVQGSEAYGMIMRSQTCTNTMENLPTPEPSIPRVSLEMPSRTGVTLLTETPLKICR